MTFVKAVALSIVFIVLFATSIAPGSHPVVRSIPQSPSPSTVPSQAVPSLDGVGTLSGSCGSLGDNCELLSTTRPKDVVIAFIIGCYSCVLTPAVDSQGLLTFSERAVSCYPSGSFGGCIREFYALANSPLDHDNISFASNGNGFAGITVFGISGANSRNIFDALLPVSQPCRPYVDTGTPSVCGVSFTVSTVSRNEFLFGVASINDGETCTQSPWTSVQDIGVRVELDSQSVNTLSQQNYSFGCPNPTADWTMVMVDGIQGHASAPPRS
jgi:hypothetical protein